MEEQSYAKHTKIVPLFHGVLFGIILVALAGSGVNLYRALDLGAQRVIASVLVALSAGMLLVAFFCRVFALKAQDRAIRAEENLRHFALAGKLLDKRLAVKQIVALRFASDEEFVALARRAADESLKPDIIKRAVTNWKVDRDRL